MLKICASVLNIIEITNVHYSLGTGKAKLAKDGAGNKMVF